MRSIHFHYDFESNDGDSVRVNDAYFFWLWKVLIAEDEIVKEEVRSKPAPALMNGDRAFEKHIRKLLLCRNHFSKV